MQLLLKVSSVALVVAVTVLVWDVADSVPAKRVGHRRFCNRAKIYRNIVSIQRQIKHSTGPINHFNCVQHSKNPVISELCRTLNEAEVSGDWCPMLVLTMTRLSALFYRNMRSYHNRRPFIAFLQFDDRLCPGYSAPAYRETRVRTEEILFFAKFSLDKICDF